jgi:hypothetical protein
MGKMATKKPPNGGLVIEKIGCGGSMPPLPNNKEMAEMFGITSNQGHAATFTEHQLSVVSWVGIEPTTFRL